MCRAKAIEKKEVGRFLGWVFCRDRPNGKHEPLSIAHTTDI